MILAEALERTGGPHTKKERAWADRILHGRPRKGEGAEEQIHLNGITWRYHQNRCRG
jgi:hypothetical protein